LTRPPLALRHRDIAMVGPRGGRAIGDNFFGLDGGDKVRGQRLSL
jgi:hypothetical protein